MVRLRAVALGLACLSFAACSNTPDAANTTTRARESCLLSNGSGVDCNAQADLTRLSTNQHIDAGKVIDVPIGALSIGATLPLDFGIVNTISKATGSPLRIDDIVIRHYDAKSPQETATDSAFTCLDGTGKVTCASQKGKWHKVVPAGTEDAAKGWQTEERFRIQYKHFDNIERKADICLLLGGDPAWQSKDLCFTLRTLKGAPRLAITPASLEFPYIPTGETGKLPLTLSNAGDVELCVSSADFVADPSFSLIDQAGVVHKAGIPVVFDPALCLPAGGSALMTVQFKPSDEKQKSGTLTFQSTDVSKPKGITVPLLGNSKVPCLQIDPSPQVNFGATVVGGVLNRDISVCSCGSQVLDLTSISLASGGSDSFALDFASVATPTQASPITLKVNECVKFKGHYSPSQLSKVDAATGNPTPESATLEVKSNTSLKSVQLQGVAVKETCPLAKILITTGSSKDPVEEVEPQKILQFSGAQSVAPGGADIVKWQWSVKKQPTGSNQDFIPSKSFPKPTFQANAAGEYVFCLKVTDSNGQDSCEEACSAVFVTPSDALHIELLWDTPGDPDQTNTGPGAGADMDLHFANPLASQSSGLDLDCDGEGDPWFDKTFDCFWLNPAPQWGNASVDVPDDGRLDLDDTDGAGPENMNLAQPEGTLQNPLQYAVGVHYWNDFGLGSSFATVRVYVLGTLTNEFKSQEMKALDMWYVGKLNWPNVKAGGGKLDPIEVCHQSGDACLALSDPKDPKGGKMWQPAGDQCITHCYTSPLAPSNQAICKP
jgi:hypothetical protein